MNLVLIPSDGTVYVDGYSYSDLDLSAAPADVHALQWKNEKCWIEFKGLDDGTKPQNQNIIELPAWANTCKIKWDEAKTAEEAARLLVPPAPPAPTKEELLAKIEALTAQVQALS
jgi:hypothetical protein